MAQSNCSKRRGIDTVTSGSHCIINHAVGLMPSDAHEVNFCKRRRKVRMMENFIVEVNYSCSCVRACACACVCARVRVHV